MQQHVVREASTATPISQTSEADTGLSLPRCPQHAAQLPSMHARCMSCSTVLGLLVSFLPPALAHY
jgi:hypothetical protein